MTRSMQTKVLDSIAAKVPHWLEFVNQPQYANTGHAYIQNGLDTVLDISYQFNSTYCTIEIEGPPIDNGGFKDSPPIYRFHPVKERERSKAKLSYHSLKYTEGDRLKGLIALIDSLLKPYKEI